MQLLIDTEWFSWGNNALKKVEFYEECLLICTMLWTMCELHKLHILIFIYLCLHNSYLYLHHQHKDDDYGYLQRAYFMQGTIPSVLHVLLRLISQPLLRVSYNATAILEMCWGTQRLTVLPKVTQCVSGRVMV